jgi:hypothetical protein
MQLSIDSHLDLVINDYNFVSLKKLNDKNVATDRFQNPQVNLIN